MNSFLNWLREEGEPVNGRAPTPVRRNKAPRSLVAALQSMHRVGLLTAVTIVAEVGDMRRFKTPRQFMADTGLVPSDHSNGASVQRGHITHTGNSLLRHVLGEAAHHARHSPRVEGALKQRQAGIPPEIVELAWRAQKRLHFRYRHLSARLGRPKPLTAVARELAGFVWERSAHGATGGVTQLPVAPVAAEGDKVFENPRADQCANHRAR